MDKEEHKERFFRTLAYTFWTMVALILLDWTIVGGFSRDHLPILPMWGSLLILPLFVGGVCFLRLAKDVHLPPQAPVDAKDGSKRV